MSPKLFGRKPPSRDVNILDLVPVARVESRNRADGRVELLDPRYKTGLLARWLQPRLTGDKAFVIVPLDDRGSAVWRLVDGRRDVSTIIRDYVAVYPQDAESASERVWRYLQMAGVNGILEFRGDSTP